jgi:hypothetical protein
VDGPTLISVACAGADQAAERAVALAPRRELRTVRATPPAARG